MLFLSGKYAFRNIFGQDIEISVACRFSVLGLMFPEQGEFQLHSSGYYSMKGVFHNLVDTSNPIMGISICSLSRTRGYL
jgi:hypothetical protein